MGEKNKRKVAFLAAHPVCCYCGVAPSEEPDHMPPRVMFLKREWPEGFEFPSCVPCNRKTRHVEQVVSFYVRCMDQDDRTYSTPEFQRLITAMRNNYRDLMPRTNLTPNEVRSALRHRGDPIPRGVLLDEIGVTLIPVGVGDMIEQFGAKLTKALYYREAGIPTPPEFVTYTRWFDFLNKDAPGAVESLREVMPNLTIGRRSNVDIFDQFSYLSGRSDDMRVFGMVAQLSKSMFIVGAAVHPSKDEFAIIPDEDLNWTRAE